MAKRQGLSASDKLMEAKSAYNAAAKSYYEHMGVRHEVRDFM